MSAFMVKNESGDVVGKYETKSEPSLPDYLQVVELDEVTELSEYDVDEWWDNS